MTEEVETIRLSKFQAHYVPHNIFSAVHHFSKGYSNVSFVPLIAQSILHEYWILLWKNI